MNSLVRNMVRKKRHTNQPTPGKTHRMSNNMKAKNRIENRVTDSNHLKLKRKGPLNKQLRSMFSPSPSKTKNRMRVKQNRSSHQKRGTNSTVTNDQNSSVVKPTADTIVIDDSEDEKEDLNAQATAIEQPLFYLDVNPGIRDEEVPLYNTHGTTEIATEAAPTRSPECSLPTPEESIIVLDNTLDQTVNASMKNMHITIEDQPAPLPSVSSTSIASVASSSAEKQSQSKSSPSTVVSEVIDLDDYPDTIPSTFSATTPAFPTMDCIPIGYDVLQPRAIGSNHSAKNRPPNTVNGGNKNGTIVNTIKSNGTTKSQELEHKKRMVIIDGNNVAYGHLNGKMFSVKGLELSIRYFKKLGHEVVAVVPQYKLKKHQSTDYVLLDKLHRQGDVTLAPSKNLPGQCSSTYDDRLILSIAEQFDGVIISNDNFRDLLDISPAWRRIIETRVIGYTWVKDCFFLPDDPYGRHGPSLQQMLNGQSV
uniref:RNase NYN domain-containing protein n=1 Tax=Anopheles farauti TaxID=69004 RepID=A0A182Q8V2_9DIPT